MNVLVAAAPVATSSVPPLRQVDPPVTVTVTVHVSVPPVRTTASKKSFPQDAAAVPVVRVRTNAETRVAVPDTATDEAWNAPSSVRYMMPSRSPVATVT
jgi:hypothetical protein